MHQFRIGEVLWGMHFEDWPEDELDEATVTVAAAVGATRRFSYDYDFADGWGHEIVVEGSWRTPQGLKHAVCLGGARACPPEDVGGPPGHEDLLRVLADPSDEDHQRITSWLVGDFDPEWFDLVEKNIALQRSGSADRFTQATRFNRAVRADVAICSRLSKDAYLSPVCP